jgi:nitrate reductase NapAB chaperone NapD
MPISSLIIRTDNKKTPDVVACLGILKEVTVSEIHQQNIVIITETPRQACDQDLWDKIEKIPGVLQCDLIFHNFEDDPVSAKW